MKKLSFILAMALATSFAMAQHVEKVTQTGTANVTTVDQSFGGSGTVLNGNEAYVTQTGYKNVADVDQKNNGYGGSQHRADVMSIGNENNAVIFQDLEDRGNAIIDQLGNKNDANIHQVGNFSAGAPLDGAYDAFAYQHGDDNDIVIDIYGTNSTAYAYQAGNDNDITQLLGSALGQKVENTNFWARQFGNDNEALQTIEGEGWAGGIQVNFNEGRINQVGNDNYAEQKMLDDILPVANLFAAVDQLGDGNKSYSTQSGQNDWTSLSQTGDENFADMTQMGSFNHAQVIQNLDSNSAINAQIGANNTLHVVQN
ncbi:MAG: hypothetical protein PHT07_04160 [Paludibacter sp.]|nr:hypothetical protein [Paludibacter sp.]